MKQRIQIKLATIIYKKYLASRRIKKKAWSFTRKVFINLLNDPICILPVHGIDIKMPLSHELPVYLNKFKFYDRLPHRISQYIHKTQGKLKCIDVGANIGDTIAAFLIKDTDTFLAIEPDPEFHKLLKENWQSNKNVIMVSDICSSENSESEFLIDKKHGTASITQVKNGIKINKKQLDVIAKEHNFLDCNILKIDTDGHDFEVIAGSKKTISSNLPMILFECDAFENPNYFNNCLNALQEFKQIGYNNFLLYDNFGNLMGIYSLSDLTSFQNLIFFQLTSDFDYFDILVIKDDDIFNFYNMEKQYFIDQMCSKPLKNSAINIAKLQNIVY